MAAMEKVHRGIHNLETLLLMHMLPNVGKKRNCAEKPFHLEAPMESTSFCLQWDVRFSFKVSELRHLICFCPFIPLSYSESQSYDLLEYIHGLI